jgi:hypothetical protein
MKLLVSGCSYTNNQTWPSFLFAPKKYKVVNLGKQGAGNDYIANSVMFNADTKPDFVYVLWSGINRTDFRVPNSNIFAKTLVGNYESTVIGNSRYFLNGHGVNPDKGWLAGYNDIKLPEWPEIASLQDWFDLPEDIKLECLQHKIYLSSHGGKENTAAFCHQYYLTQQLDINREYRSERTFQNLVNCFNMLDKFNIPYRFSFIYDIWNKNEWYGHGVAIKDKYYNFVDWGKFINLPPYQYGIKYDLLSQDGYHLTDAGMNQWAGEISKILQKDKELQHLF